MDDSSQLRWRLILLLGLAGALVILLACAVRAQSAVSVHLTLGNPSEAVPDAEKSPDNFLMVKPQYCLSYNRSRGEANWVAWHLSKTDLGSAPRANDFRADDALPPAWFHATKAVYDNTGFDCGHLCPSSDRTRHAQDNRATFLLTNMIPQAPRNNRVAWKMLETYERDLALAGNELYLIAGPYGCGGKGANGYKSQIGAQSVPHAHGKLSVGFGTVTVPASCWKVLLVLEDRDGDDLGRIDAQTRVIAAVLPNTETVAAGWTGYVVPVDDLEKLTGFVFFRELRPALRHILGAKVDGANEKNAKQD